MACLPAVGSIRAMIPAPAISALRATLAGTSDVLRVAAVPADLDPLAFVRSAAQGAGRAAYFGMPGGVEVGGVGTAWRTAAAGPDRLATIAAAVAGLDLPAEARVLTGFSFNPDGPVGPVWDGFAAATALLPATTVVRTPDATHLVLAVPAGVDPARRLADLGRLTEATPPRPGDAEDASIEANPPPGAWRELVADTVAAIAGGAMRKVVLAREVAVRTLAASRPFGLLHLLRDGHPQCYAFGWQEADGVFVGASPELLVARHGERVRSHPLAGTAPRGEGEDDEAVGRSLLLSAKDQAEHAQVVEDIAARLALLTTELAVPARPSLRRLANVQHLSTEIGGRLVVDRSVLELAGELHPTPAVGGAPRGEALAYIDKVETFNRGWYTGGVGWAAPGGDGEVAVALRCGMFREGTVHLYAGAGIVAGSDPDAELAETRLKLRPLAELLTLT